MEKVIVDIQKYTTKTIVNIYSTSADITLFGR